MLDTEEFNQLKQQYDNTYCMSVSGHPASELTRQW